ncbi:MAG TPA: CHAT domain-containing protein [Cyclobacteriaceae bacterium]|jgi:CHAT domain-containing protein|nr:CHAT domain-containing protein [Cyclobacteriaceae bacterium]
MKSGLLYCIMVSLSVTAYCQGDRVTNLLDSAKNLWYLDFDKTNEFVKQAEGVVNGRKDGNLTALIHLYNLRILSCNAFSRFQLWRQYINELDTFLEENKKLLSPEEYKLFSLRNDLLLAQYFNAISDNGKALELLVKLQSDFKTLPQSADVCYKLGSIANDIADIHSLNGEYEASVNQYLASIPYFECAAGNKTGLGYYSLIYRNIGAVYFEKKDYLNAGRYFKLAEDSLQHILKETPTQAARIALSLYESESLYYIRIEKNDSAMLSMQKAIPLLKLKNVDDSFKGRISFSLCNVYVREKKFKLAQSYLDQAEKYFLNSPEDRPVQLSKIYLTQADILDKLGETRNSLKYCDKALEKLSLNYKTDADGNLTLTELLSKKHVFKILQKKSRLLKKLFDERKDYKDLVKAFNTNNLSLALLDSTANEISLDKDKVILAEEGYSAFEDGIRMSYKLYQHTKDNKYLDDCFRLVDKGKGTVLLQNLRVVNRFSGINPEWLDREKEIKSELLFTEQNLYKLEIENRNSSELASTRERYATLKRDYASLINKIKIEAPDYYRLRFDHSIISTSEVQSQSLRNGEAMIEYFVGDSTIAMIGLARGKREIQVKKISNDFYEKINQLRNSLINARDIKEDTVLTKISPTLYSFLIQDVIEALGPGITSLTLIPDGILGYLPFEILRDPNDAEKKYLGEKYTIRYAYSATYLNEQMRKKTEAKYFFAGFASSSMALLNNQKLAALPGVEKEITAITELLGSGFSIFNPATKNDFMERAKDFRVLHLAMHSLVNEENPMFSVLVFSPSANDSTDNHLLTALELYDMTLNSDLAVLSGCNSGFGTLHRGEGIMSFSRSLAYAGVPSAVISLWQVPDKATSKIMVSFYKYLKAGESKDRALQLAKLDLIRNYPQMSAPFYWAGFILTGNKEPLKFPSSQSWYWIVVFLMMAELILIVAKRKMNTR